MSIMLPEKLKVLKEFLSTIHIVHYTSVLFHVEWTNEIEPYSNTPEHESIELIWKVAKFSTDGDAGVNKLVKEIYSKRGNLTLGKWVYNIGAYFAWNKFEDEYNILEQPNKFLDDDVCKAKIERLDNSIINKVSYDTHSDYSEYGVIEL